MTLAAEVRFINRTVYVPGANDYEIDKDKFLHLRTAKWGQALAVFQPGWEYVVITPDRGPDGKFIKKGSI